MWYIKHHIYCVVISTGFSGFQNHWIEFVRVPADRRKTLEWRKRHEILLGVANGLAYLHEEPESIFAHGDIKAGNIMLDPTMKPKIADWGLAALFRNDQGEVKPRNMVSVWVLHNCHSLELHLSIAKIILSWTLNLEMSWEACSSRLACASWFHSFLHRAKVNESVFWFNRGYMSPELALDGQLSAKSDVFSFGILCLEVISGRQNTDINLLGTEMQTLLSWVRPSTLLLLGILIIIGAPKVCHIV